LLEVFAGLIDGTDGGMWIERGDEGKVREDITTERRDQARRTKGITMGIRRVDFPLRALEQGNNNGWNDLL